MQQVPLKLNTNSATVNVKELPEKNKPVDFAGAVGNYKFETSLSNKQAKTDEPITYTLKISGTGNLKFVDAPALKFPQEFEVYDPKTKENITNGATGMIGTKQYDYLIIPRQPGEYAVFALLLLLAAPGFADFAEFDGRWVGLAWRWVGRLAG